MALVGRNVSRVLSAVKDVCLGFNFTALALMGHPRSIRRYASEAILLRHSFAPLKLHARSASQVVACREDIRLQVLSNGENWFAREPSFSLDILNLCMLCRGLNAKNIFEIGTFHGYTALHLAMNSPEDAVVYTLDLGSNI